MDVHAPHHPLHTWKDFWIHLATITVGLLIAIGLEQSVEGLHRLHQRHQLEEDLRSGVRTDSTRAAKHSEDINVVVKSTLSNQRSLHISIFIIPYYHGFTTRLF